MAEANQKLGEPKVSVIIPIFRNWDDVYVCVEALLRQTYRGKFEILVVNNDAKGEFPSRLTTTDRVRLLHEPKAGSYAARNAGIRAAAGEIFAFTDADCIPDNEWIERAIAGLKANPEASRLAGKIELTFRHPKKHSPVELFEQVFAFQQERKVNEEGSAITANMFARCEVFETVGDFDESMKSGGDSDWGIRAAKAGFGIIYVPGVRVLHPARYSWGQLYSKTVRLYGGKWQRAHRVSQSPLTIGQKAKIFKPGTSTVRSVFRAPQLSSYEKLKVFLVILFVGTVQLSEHVRLLIGGSPRRD